MAEDCCVDTDGELVSCQATPAQGLSVMSGAQDLGASPGGEGQNGDGLVDLIVSVDAALAEERTVTVVCRDIFGQTSNGVYVAKP